MHLSEREKPVFSQDATLLFKGTQNDRIRDRI